jgi:teichuronic acid biosynthesis glycosyltransferase TuaC
VALAGVARGGLDPEGEEIVNRTATGSDRLRVLVLSRNYPNNVMDLLGVWVQGQVRETAKFCDVKVVSPTPYCPPLPYLPTNYARFRQVARKRWDHGIESIHPRMIVGPGSTTFTSEWWLYLASVRRSVRMLRKEFPFDLIHAQFTYPDGVVAAWLGRQYDVPVVITEHNSWVPWINDYASVRRRSVWAARQCARHISVSQAVRRTVEQFVGPGSENVTVIPNGVDPSEFPLGSAVEDRNPDQLLFVGAIRPVKGVDLLLRAIRILVDRGRAVHLLLVGEAFYGRYKQEELRLMQMTHDLGIADRVRFAGKQVSPQLGQTMGQSALLVVPSRIEAFGMVLIEALACGTPVVATRSGGPEEIVNDRVGVLVTPEDPEALARGIEHVLERRRAYDPALLRAHALEKFGARSVGERLRQVYEDAVQRHRGAPQIHARPVEKLASERV